MFLFTTLAPTATRDDTQPIPSALRAASNRSGVSFDYLMATAKRESAFNPRAQAGTSSARGLFQFVEQTWLRMVQSRGQELGLGAEAQAITSRGGRLTVPDEGMRSRILALRDDPKLSAELAAELTRDNRAGLVASLGREPTQGELYIAHFLGLSGASRLIKASEERPGVAAATLFPDAARANRSIFYDRSGAARTNADVYGRLVRGFDAQAGVDVAARTTPEQGNPFHRLFRSAGAQPVAQAVAANFLPLAQRAEPAGAPLDIRPPATFFTLRSRG